MLAMFDYSALHQFETHINGFLDPEPPNFDPNHDFLSSIEAEMINLLPKKRALMAVI